jgi:hypothetical protein
VTKIVFYDKRRLAPGIRRAAPELQVVMHGEAGASDAEIAACWNPPHAALAAITIGLQIARNALRLINAQALINQVDVQRGY